MDSDEEAGATVAEQNAAKVSKTAFERATMTRLKIERFYEDLILESDERDKRYARCRGVATGVSATS